MKAWTQYSGLKTTVVLLLASISPLAMRAQTGAKASSALPASTTNWKTTVHGKHLTIRINPEANLSLYNAINVGTVAYTGPSKKLKAQESDKMVSLLRDSLTKDLSSVRLGPDVSATRRLTVNANITSVKRSHPLVNVVTIAAVFVPLDLGGAKVTAWIADEETGQNLAEIETVGCGQIYQVLGSLQALGQSKIVLKKQSRSIAKEVERMHHNQQPANLTAALSFNQ